MAIENQFFQQMVHEWYDALYRFAVSLCRDPDDAADLTQTTFYKFATKGDAIADRKKAKSWLFSVLHREFIDQYRRNQRYPSTSLELVAEPVSSDRTSPSGHLDGQTAMTALGQLDEKFRAPLALFYLEHFSYKEIASTLDIPIGTVMSRLRRAKDQLRDRLQDGERAMEPSNRASPIPFSRKEASS